jgi:hypothetical protein
MKIADFLLKAQEALGSDSDSWLLHIKTDLSYTINGDGKTVKRDGGTQLISRAHGHIAELVTDGEIVLKVKPTPELPWRVVERLFEALDGSH